MNRAILALFMTFALVNAFTYKGNGFTSDGLFQFVDTTCNGAISGFNKGIQKLISNIQTQSNEWLVYSDLDTLDGYAYHLQNLCDPEDYELTTQLQGGQTPEQQQACSNLLALLGSILDQNQPQAFKSGYEQGLALSNQALTFGPNIVKGCKISIVVDAEAQDDEDSSAEEENGEEEELGLNGENGEEAGVSDDSDAPVILAAKLNIFAQKEADEDSSDDSSDESNEEEWAGEEWNNDDPLAITKAWDIGQVADKVAKIAKKIAQIANEEAGVSDDSDALGLIFAANNVFAQKEADEDSSDDSSDESDEEEWAGEEWNNEDPLAITKAWDIGAVADKVAKIAKKIAEIANEEAGVSDDSDAPVILAAKLNLLAQKEADEDSSDESSDESNEEEWAGEEWNNEDSLATTKAWNIGTVADKIAKIAKKIAEIAENNEEETLAITKAWDSEKVADKIAKIAKKIAKQVENNEEDALTAWDKGDWSDFSHFGSNDEQDDLSDSPKSTFFYEVNPNGNTDSGSDWLNGDYNRYIPGGSGTGNTGTPSIPSIPGIGGNGGTKTTFLAAIGQQASGNPWTSGDYKRYYSGDSGNGGAPAKFLAFKQDNAPEDLYWTI